MMARRVALLLACWLLTGIAFGDSLFAYLRDQHYQEHFVYLWLFFALTLLRTLRGPFRLRFGLTLLRDRLALLTCALAYLLAVVGALAGSSTSRRVALGALLTSLSLVAVARWSWRRCVMHGLLLLLCFGIPYSMYFPITSRLQFGVAELLALPANWGWVDYQMVGHVVVLPNYRLAITANCSGLGQLLTFLGIAGLGVLSSRPARSRTIWVTVAAVLLAWLSNLARVACFIGCLAWGWHDAVDDAALHAGIGFLVFLPFAMALIWLLLRTHQPLVRTGDVAVAPGRWHIAWLLLPMFLVTLAKVGEPPQLPKPRFFDALKQPPAHQLIMHGPSEAADKLDYGTPWLLNARFGDAAGHSFDLFYYATNTREQLSVHKVANCLYVPGAAIRYLPSVQVGGKEWWRVSIDVGVPELSSSVYFAFEVDGERCDDSSQSSWRVLRNRMLGGDGNVQLWRVAFPGAAQGAPSDYEATLLEWLSRLAD